MLRPRTPPLKASKLQAALNSLETMSVTNINNNNSINENNNQLILNTSVNSNLTYIESNLIDTQNSVLSTTEQEKVQIIQKADGQN